MVYVPKHFNITEWVGMTEKTVLSYWQLNRLWKDYGDVIYDRSVPELYQTYPQYFINIYENGDTCPEAAAGYPIQVKKETDFLTGNRQTAGTREDMAAQKDVIRVFYERRNEAIRSYLDRGESLRYIATYFDENLEEKEIPWCAETQQSGILVHGIRAREAKGSQIIRCDGSKTLRQQLKKPESEAGEKAGQPDAKLQLFSNFLFFLTPKPAQLYNELRADRPGEQIDFTQGHLDYMLYEKDGKRIETFPLWRKACIAMKKDGRFLFFHYRLGSGVMTVGNYSISWTEADVDTPTGDDTEHSVRIYTPYFSQADQEADSAAYVLPVGENRLNLVVIQERIFAIRRGEVLLPSIGVVISLDMEHGEAFLRQTGCRELEDGYYDCGGLEFRLNLDGPAQIAPEEWQQVEWAFGGGLSLILNGAAIYGEEESSDWLVKEGWLSPLSRQTQESEIHMPARHPRTAIGIAENGDLVILVFSGRTFMSTGADYRDMCRIAKKLIPDIWCMMNVDGGGSSVLGMAIDGNFMELSYPATSLGSTAGMVRQVNTVLCLEQ